MLASLTGVVGFVARRVAARSSRLFEAPATSASAFPSEWSTTCGLVVRAHQPDTSDELERYFDRFAAACMH